MALKTIKPDIARHRSSGVLAPVTGNYDTLNADCSHLYWWHRNGPQTLGWVGTTAVTDDWVSPGFRERSAKGEIIIKPYKHTAQTHATSGEGHWMQSVNKSCTAPDAYAVEALTGPWIFPQAFGSTKMATVSLIDEADIASLVAIASTSAWSNANRSTAGVLQDIAEMRQTVNMLMTPIQTQRRLLSKIFQRRKRGVFGARRKGSYGVVNLGGVGSLATSNWLQYRYGVRPFVSSVKGVLDAIGNTRMKHRQTIRGNASLSKQQTSTGTVSNFVGANVSWSRFDADTVIVRAGMILEESVSIAQNLGLTGGQLLALPWELVPYSFVADWFANVGSFLEGVVPYVTKSPLGSWYTVNRIRTSNFSVTGTVPTNPAAYSVQRAASEFRTLIDKTVERIPGLPAPSLAFRPGSVGKVFSDLRVVDMFSLLTQQMNRAFRG